MLRRVYFLTKITMPTSSQFFVYVFLNLQLIVQLIAVLLTLLFHCKKCLRIKLKYPEILGKFCRFLYFAVVDCYVIMKLFLYLSYQVVQVSCLLIFNNNVHFHT